MGLIEFVQNAGEKLFGAGDAAAAPAADPQAQSKRATALLAIGNAAGVAGVDDGLEVVEAAPGARWYTVQRGDTLSKFAKAHYGDANRYPAIFEANRPMLKDPDKIYPGQVLRIPA